MELSLQVQVWLYGMILSWLMFIAPETSGLIRPPKNSGCSAKIKNYGCYCPNSAGRKIPSKCTNMFDEELMNSANGWPAPVKLTYPSLSPELDPIDLNAGVICVKEKYCEIKVTPTDKDDAVIDWCITTEASNLYHIQILGPPFSPVCCDNSDDQKYTMLCMRRDLNLQWLIENPLLISVYIKLLPRASIKFRLSLVLLNKPSVANVIPAEFTDKKNTGGALVKLLNVEDMVLDLSTVTKWEDL